MVLVAIREDEALPELPLPSPTSVLIPAQQIDNTANTSPRWKALQEKRQLLQKKRVALEEKLFSYQAQETQEPKKRNFLNSNAIKYTLENKRVSFKPTDGSSTGKKRQNNELPTGTGILKMEDQVYTGSVVNGERSGRGRNEWFDPNDNVVYQVYQGEWLNNRRNGRGTHKWMDGRQVTGTWTNGVLQGKVYFSWPDGSTYDGEVVNGQKEGRGVQKWADGKLYNGQYVNGFEHGYGTLTEADGASTYRGQFYHGKRHGYGLQVWPLKTYDGEWKQNVVSGHGKLTWSSGAVYSGSFLNGQYEGHGSFVNGKSKFFGNWKKGLKEGYGEQTWTPANSKYRSYRGNYKESRREGFGRMVYADGSIYAGEWLAGQRHGIGIMINSYNEIIHCGSWRKNEYVRKDMKRGRYHDDFLLLSLRRQRTQREVPQAESKEYILV